MKPATRLEAYARMVVDAGATYAILRRNKRTVFCDAFTVIVLDSDYANALVPGVLGAPGTVPDIALRFGRNPTGWSDVDATWARINEWSTEPCGRLLLPRGPDIDTPALYGRNGTDRAARFEASDGREVYINTRLIDLVEPDRRRLDRYNLDISLPDMRVRMRERYGNLLYAILMPIERGHDRAATELAEAHT